MEVIFLKAAKGIGAFSLVLWLAIMGIVVALPVAVLTGRPEGSTNELAAALGAAALGFGAGALYFVALQHGQLSVVSPIVATPSRGGGARGGAAARRAARRGARGRPPGGAGRDGARGGRARRRRPPGDRAGGRLRHRPRVLRRGARRDRGRGRRHVGRGRVPRAHARGPAAARRAARSPAPAARPPPAARVAVVLETIGFAAFAYALAARPVGPVAAIAVQYSTVAVVGAAVVLHERLPRGLWLGSASSSRRSWSSRCHGGRDAHERLRGPRAIRMADAPDPQPGPGEAVVAFGRPASAAATCTSGAPAGSSTTCPTRDPPRATSSPARCCAVGHGVDAGRPSGTASASCRWSRAARARFCRADATRSARGWSTSASRGRAASPGGAWRRPPTCTGSRRRLVRRGGAARLRRRRRPRGPPGAGAGRRPRRGSGAGRGRPGAAQVARAAAPGA